MRRTTGILLCCVAALLALGMVMVFSVVSARASALSVGVKYLAKHAIWAAIGLVGLWLMSRLDYRRLERNRWLIAALGAAVLIAVLIPGIGTKRNSARRWLRFGPVGFQPSEMAKLALLVTVSAMVARRGEGIRDFRRGLLPCMAVVGVASVLILAEPDFGTAALVGGVGTLVILAGGARLAPIAAAGGVGVAALSLLIWQSHTRLERVFAFLDPWGNQDTAAGYHVKHSLTALGSGGLVGRSGMQKLFFLPESDADFLFSIIGEELGLVGTLGVIVVFVILIRQGMRVSERAPDAFGALLAFGITLMIALQALMHIAVVTASMPTKGITLPFVSSGGSSLLVSMMGIGILLNIAAHEHAEAPAARRGGHTAMDFVALPNARTSGHEGG